MAFGGGLCGAESRRRHTGDSGAAEAYSAAGDVAHGEGVGMSVALSELRFARMSLVEDDYERLTWRDLSGYASTGMRSLFLRLRDGIVQTDRGYELQYVTLDLPRICVYWLRSGGRPGSGGFQGDLPIRSLRVQRAFPVPTVYPLFETCGVPVATLDKYHGEHLWICVLQRRRRVGAQWITDKMGDVKIGQSYQPKRRYKVMRSHSVSGIRLTDSPDVFDLRVMFHAEPGLSDRVYRKQPGFVPIGGEWVEWNQALEIWIQRMRIQIGAVTGEELSQEAAGCVSAMPPAQHDRVQPRLW